jgi:hypothetical protein
LKELTETERMILEILYDNPEGLNVDEITKEMNKRIRNKINDSDKLK